MPMTTRYATPAEKAARSPGAGRDAAAEATTAVGNRIRRMVPQFGRTGAASTPVASTATGAGSTSSMTRAPGRGVLDRSGPNRDSSAYPTIVNSGKAYTTNRYVQNS